MGQYVDWPETQWVRDMQDALDVPWDTQGQDTGYRDTRHSLRYRQGNMDMDNYSQDSHSNQESRFTTDTRVTQGATQDSVTQGHHYTQDSLDLFNAAQKLKGTSSSPSMVCLRLLSQSTKSLLHQAQYIPRSV